MVGILVTRTWLSQGFGVIRYFDFPVSGQESDSMIDTTERQDDHRRSSAGAACLLIAVCALTSGCDQGGISRPLSGGSPQVGGGVTLTSERLSGLRLKAIREPLSWRFGKAIVMIDFDGKPIPQDLAETILGDGVTAASIEASWRYDEPSGKLHLSGVQADGKKVEREVAISIGSAGPIRVNLGTRQYNMFYDRASDP